MNLVLADTFYFLALLNRRDEHHARATAFSKDFKGRILTTDWILVEVADAFAASEMRGRVREFALQIGKSPAFEIVPASRVFLESALDLYHQHRDKEWTLTDCASFVLMRDRKITEALTADHHFEQAGFTALLK